MTKLLYLDQTLATAAEATCNVVEVLETDKGTAIVLDQTPFYPEGGGQPADHGKIGNSNIIDVQSVDGKILHYADSQYVSQPLDQLTDLLCTVDGDRRRDLTEQHSGQHLLSAVLHRDFDAKTVGFHLSETYTSIDIDKKLSPEAFELVEKTCLELISKGLKITAVYPSDEELEQLPLRKQPKVEDNIRIIVIEGLDHSPCGGTHASLTSEIIGLKITKLENYKGGTRIEFVCGHRFIDYLQSQYRLLDTLTQRYSAPLDQLLDQLEKRELAAEALKKQNQQLTDSLLQLEVDAWLEKLEDDLAMGSFSPLYIYQYDDRPLDHLRKLSQIFVESQDQVGLMLLSKQSAQTQIVLARPKTLNQFDCKAIFAKCAKSFNVKGGGSNHSAQGSLPDPEQTEMLIQFVEEQLDYTTLSPN